MFKSIIENFEKVSKTIIYDNNKIEIGHKPLLGEGKLFYNNIPVETKSFFGGLSSVFVVIENNRHVYYDITIRFRWHYLSFYTVVKRQGHILYSDK
jgi:hypothetical protein